MRARKNYNQLGATLKQIQYTIVGAMKDNPSYECKHLRLIVKDYMQRWGLPTDYAMYERDVDTLLGKAISIANPHF